MVHDPLGEEPRHQCRLVSGREALQVFAVEPGKFFFIEYCSAFLDFPEVEDSHELSEREELLVGSRIPSQERKEIDECGRKVSPVAVLGDRERAGAFRQLRPVGGEDEREVGIGGDRRPERFINQNLPGRVRHVVFAADDVRHPLFPVVNDNGKVEDRLIETPSDDEITELGGVEGNAPPNQVVEGHRGLRISEANDFCPVSRRLLGDVGGASRDETFQVSAVTSRVFALAVPGVGLESEPSKALENIALVLGFRSFPISVFDSEDEPSAGTLGVEIGKKRCPVIAGVEEPGGAGSKPSDDVRTHARGKCSRVREQWCGRLPGDRRLEPPPA